MMFQGALLRRVPYFNNMLASMFTVLPTIVGQAVVIGTMFHIAAYTTLFMWGASDVPDAAFLEPDAGYHRLRFGNYPVRRRSACCRLGGAGGPCQRAVAR